MTDWNYRVIKKSDISTGEETYQVHEVYYNSDGSIDCWTQHAVEPIAVSEVQLSEDIRLFLRAFRFPVLEENYKNGQHSLVESASTTPMSLEGGSDYAEKVVRVMNYVSHSLGRDELLQSDEKVRMAYEYLEQALFDLLAASSSPLNIAVR